MPLTADEFRSMALSFGETVESAHMGHPDFRVRGKIFATLSADETLGMVKLTPSQQEAFVEAESGVFVPVKGAWGLRGATHVRLAKARKSSLLRALDTAWRNIAYAKKR